MAEKVRCLNPVGISESVDTFPLAPRLDKVEGKTTGEEAQDRLPGRELDGEKDVRHKPGRDLRRGNEDYGRPDTRCGMVKRRCMGAVALRSRP